MVSIRASTPEQNLNKQEMDKVCRDHKRFERIGKRRMD